MIEFFGVEDYWVRRIELVKILKEYIIKYIFLIQVDYSLDTKPNI